MIQAARQGIACKGQCCKLPPERMKDNMAQKGQRKAGLLEKTAQLFDLPADVLAGLPRLELVGDGELRLENHRGILSYGREEIHVSAGAYIIKISGRELTLRAMTGLELLITGKIEHIELV